MKKTRYIPYGYTMRDGRTVVDHGEAAIIREIFATYIEGASLKEIAESLTKRKIPYTEKSDVWDKARVARIIDNAKYLGLEEYDPIIDEKTFEAAGSTKAARTRNEVKSECEGIRFLRNRVKCAGCGSMMVRRVSSKTKVRESWQCAECGCRVRISDGDLIRKVTLQINRIIDNADLMIPKEKLRRTDSPVVASLQAEIERELDREHASEAFVIEKISQIASQMYRESQAKQVVAAQIARKRALMMKPQDTFNPAYFSDLISYITIDTQGYITLHTKTDTEVKEEQSWL